VANKFDTSLGAYDVSRWIVRLILKRQSEIWTGQTGLIYDPLREQIPYARPLCAIKIGGSGQGLWVRKRTWIVEVRLRRPMKKTKRLV